MNDLLSIIIPVYNIDQYISRCLDSLINQTYKNLEIIIVDDGSTDNTASIIDEYAKKDKRIIIIHKKNEGVSLARIAGMEKANGKYVGFVDGDDIAEKDMFEMLMKNAKEYDADISHCGYVMDFPDGHSDYYYNTGKIIVQNNQKGLIDLIQGKYIDPGLWNKIYRKKLIKKFVDNHDIVDYSIKNLEDLLTNYYLFKYSRISIYEDICKYHYMLRENSAATSTVNENKLSDPLKVLKIMLKENTQENIYYELILVRLIRQLIALSTMSSKANSKLIRPHKKKARRELRSQLLSILKCKECCFRVKVMAVWVAISPTTYQIIHFLYEKYTGLDKKYSLEK